MKFEFLVKNKAIYLGKVKGIFGNSLIGRKNSNVQKFWKFGKIEENPNSKIPHFQENSNNFLKKLRNIANFVKNIHSAKFQKCPTFFLKNVKISPIFEKLGRKVAVKEVNFCIFGVVLVRIHFVIFKQNFRPRKFCWISRKVQKLLKLVSEKLYF